MYKIAIISDSHDNLPALNQAVSIMRSLNVKQILHLGDFIAPFALAPLIESGMPWYGVLGNNDGERNGLLAKAGGAIFEEIVKRLDINGKSIVMTHRPEDLPDNLSNADLALCGHTHRHFIEFKDNVLYVNPGELCGYLTGMRSFVVMDIETFSPETIYF